MICTETHRNVSHGVRDYTLASAGSVNWGYELRNRFLVARVGASSKPTDWVQGHASNYTGIATTI